MARRKPTREVLQGVVLKTRGKGTPPDDRDDNAIAALTSKVDADQLTLSEASIVLKYILIKRAEAGFSVPRQKVLIHVLARIARELHVHDTRLDTVTTTQAMSVIDSFRDKDYERNYRRMLLGEFKRFLLWRAETDGSIDEKAIRKVTVPGINRRAVTSEDILDESEIERLIGACTKSRDRALISMAYDMGCRSADIRSITWGDVTFDTFGPGGVGAKVRLMSKTDYERFVRLTFSVPYLSAWKNDYPGEPLPDRPVFISARGKFQPITRSTIEFLIVKLRKETGISKARPGIFRHSRISHDVEGGVDPAYITMRSWGHLNTGMLTVYGKPRDVKLDLIAMQSAGINVEPPPDRKPGRPKKLLPTTCPQCSETNGPGIRFCGNCGLSLTEEGGASQERAARAILSDPALLRKYADDLEKKGRSG